MQEMTAKDLKESLTLLLYRQQKDEEGGWKDTWKKGPHVWASMWPTLGKNGFHEKDEGGPMASQWGYMQTLPPPSYRVVMRAGIDVPLKSRFLWTLRHLTKHLLLVNQPVLIQYNRFLCMTVVEEKAL